MKLKGDIRRTVTFTNAHRGIAVPFGMLWGYLQTDPVNLDAEHR